MCEARTPALRHSEEIRWRLSAGPRPGGIAGAPSSTRKIGRTEAGAELVALDGDDGPGEAKASAGETGGAAADEPDRGATGLRCLS